MVVVWLARSEFLGAAGAHESLPPLRWWLGLKGMDGGGHALNLNLKSAFPLNANTCGRACRCALSWGRATWRAAWPCWRGATTAASRAARGASWRRRCRSCWSRYRWGQGAARLVGVSLLWVVAGRSGALAGNLSRCSRALSSCHPACSSRVTCCHAQADMYAKARAEFDGCIERVTTWDDFMAALGRNHMALAPW